MNTVWRYLHEERWSELISFLDSSDEARQEAGTPRTYNPHRFPLHSSILNHAPDDVVLSLLKAFPNAATMRLYESLPLHTAIKENRSLDVVKALVDIFPDGLKMPDETKRLPLGIALEAGRDEKQISYLLHSWNEAKDIRCNGKMPSQIAAEKGMSPDLVQTLETTDVKR
mmetsp:Transcript_3991/g.5792  ORF Transcript_3991/g.5792 Transcript_3991/m.5792 type:complete len:170 (-) Transcript_3991:1837-2346(-)